MAEAGQPLIAYVGDTVFLDGSASNDPEGDAIIYIWSQASGPPVELEGPDRSNPSFKITGPGTLRFSLIVNDGTADSEPDIVAVVVPFEAITDPEGGCSHTGGSAYTAWGVGLAAGLMLWRRR